MNRSGPQITLMLVWAVPCVLMLASLEGCSKADSEALSDHEARMAEFKRQVDEADRLWESDDKEKAVELYTSVMHNPDGAFYLDAERRNFSTVASRVIDYKITNHGPESARDEIELAARIGGAISVSTPEGNEFVAQVKQQYSERNRGARQSTGQTTTRTSKWTVEQARKVQVGMSPEQVIEVLGEPDHRQTGVPPFHEEGALLFFRYNGGQGPNGFSNKGSTFIHFAENGEPTNRVTLIQIGDPR